MDQKDREKLKEIGAWHTRASEGEAEEQVQRLHDHRGWLLDLIAKEQGGSLTQARALLQRTQRACAVVAGLQSAGAAEGRQEAGQLRAEIDAFLAGLPVTSEPSAEAAERCSGGDAETPARRVIADRIRALPVEPQRPRVGPWVGTDGRVARHDDRGAVVANIEQTGDAWEGWARVAFAPTQHMGRRTEEDARKAVDAVLRTWADLEGIEVFPAGERKASAQTVNERNAVDLLDIDRRLSVTGPHKAVR